MSAERWRDAGRAWKRLGPWFDEKRTGPGSRGREPDPLDALGDLGDVRRVLDEVELRAVRGARQRGRSWAEIATRLGVTRQAAWERWRDLDETAAEPEPRLPRLVVPDVVGRPVVDARQELELRGLAVAGRDLGGATIDDPSVSHALVVDQSPEAGATVPAGTIVVLWIERGEGGVRAPLDPGPDLLLMHKYLPEPTGEWQQVG